MSLFTYKWLTALLIGSITLLAGFASLHFIKRYRRLLEMGDALADGIFLGAAAFHLFPNALEDLSPHFSGFATYGLSLLLTACGFILLFLLERAIIRGETPTDETCSANAWMLAGILSVHAFIAGIALGISDTVASVSVLLIAILAHKGFESFALALGLHRSWQQSSKTKGVLFCFAFVTPLGIMIASIIDTYFQAGTTHLITGVFSAFAAGTFLYIGTLHTTHNHFHPGKDQTQRYYRITATVAGIIAMGIVGIWV